MAHLQQQGDSCTHPKASVAGGAEQENAVVGAEGEAEQVAHAALNAAPGASGLSRGYIRLRGLPFAVGEAEIRDFFQDYELVQVFVCKRAGRSTGEAFVQLQDSSRSQEAIQAQNRKQMGHRYIELFEATEADMNTAKTLSQDRLMGYVVRMRGLPFTASANDVLTFFNGVDIVRGIEGVIFTWTPDGRPTGEAFVELKDEHCQKEAMKRHKELMGNRYIELFTSSKADLVQAIQHNRLILGFTNRKRWLQQQGIPPHMMFPQLPIVPNPLHHVMPPRSNMVGYMGNMEEMSNLFAGINMGGPAGMRGMQHPQMMAAARGGPMFNTGLIAGGRGAGMGGRGGRMGGGRGSVMGGRGFRHQMSAGGSLRTPLGQGGGGANAAAAGMMARPMAHLQPNLPRPYPNMLAQAQQQMQQGQGLAVPLSAAAQANPAMLMQQQQQQPFLRSHATQSTLDSPNSNGFAPVAGLGLGPQDPLFAQQQAQQQQQQQQRGAQRPVAGSGPFMNVPAAPPAYTLAIHLPPSGPMQPSGPMLDAFQQQLPSGLEAPQASQMKSNMPISMPNLSAADMIRIARKQQEGSGVVLPQ